jgi:hypothetical protein
MSNERQGFKKLLSKLAGLRIVADDLFLSENDRLIFVSRFTDLHPSEGPDKSLDVGTLHDKLLELMENCHTERDAMWARSRMEPRFWRWVHASTSWTTGVTDEALRTLALGLTQAAWAHFKNPRRNSKGEPQPHCKLAIAALRFAFDIAMYEGHLHQPKHVLDMDFSEWRAPVYLENGKRLKGTDKKQVTMPVFPIYRYDAAINHAPAPGTLSQDWFATREEPNVIKFLKRV